MVGADDVRRVAALARLALSEERLSALAAELDAILAQMQVLQSVDLERLGPSDDRHDETPLRADSGPALPLARERESVAPLMRDGFFLVPRLASHEDAGGAA